MKKKVLEAMKRKKWGIKKHSLDDVLTEWDIIYTRQTRR